MHNLSDVDTIDELNDIKKNAVSKNEFSDIIQDI